MLPAAVRLKADESNRLMTEAGKPAPVPAAAAPAGEDVQKLKADLAAAQEATRAAEAKAAAARHKFDAEVPSLKATISSLKAKADELEATLRKKVESGEITSLSDNERKLMGEDMIPASAKIAREVAQGEIKAQVDPLKAEIERLKADQQAAFFAALDDGFPSWETQNKDPKFMGWLHDVDKESGRLRVDVLKRAEAGLNAPRVIEVFRSFKEGREIGAPKVSDPQEKLENREAPGPGAGGGNPPADAAEGRLWTRREIAAFYREKREGKYRGKDDEARKIELDIYAAQKAGRVRG